MSALGLAEIQEVADLKGWSLARAAIINGRDSLVTKEGAWFDIIQIDEPNQIEHNNICDHDLFMCRLANEVSRQYSFPRNTTFLHSLGVVASAMVKSFNVNYWGENTPVTLYVATGQPPSSGKSGVNKFYSNPVNIAFEEINKKNKVERKKAARRVEALKVELKNKEKAGQAQAIDAVMNDLDSAEEELEQYPIYKYSVSNATPEALEAVAGRQGGMFNVISAEADSINILLGGVYSPDKKASLDIPLSAWDGEWYSGERISREAYTGFIRGCVAVIAQPEGIDTLLNVGTGGRGISERVLILKEKDLLGHRDHSNFYQVDPDMKAQYKMMIENIVNESEVNLKITKEAWQVITDYRINIEPQMKELGIYGNNLLRGFVGKADKHIIKIASVLHVSEQWHPTGKRLTTINPRHVFQATAIFQMLVDSYVATAEDLGYLGHLAELEKVVETLQSYTSKRRYKVSFKQLKDSVKNSVVFKTFDNVTPRLRDKILPELESRNYLIMHKGQVHINPSV